MGRIWFLQPILGQKLIHLKNAWQQFGDEQPSKIHLNISIFIFQKWVFKII